MGWLLLQMLLFAESLLASMVAVVDICMVQIHPTAKHTPMIQSGQLLNDCLQQCDGQSLVLMHTARPPCEVRLLARSTTPKPKHPNNPNRATQPKCINLVCVFARIRLVVIVFLLLLSSLMMLPLLPLRLYLHKIIPQHVGKRQ
eukprot:6069338-Amphidinium_carterae.2